MPSKSSTEDVANEAAMRSNQPNEAVADTLMRIAKGAACAAPAVSSEMCAAESSANQDQRKEKLPSGDDEHPVRVHIGAVNASRKAQPSVEAVLSICYLARQTMLTVTPTSIVLEHGKRVMS